MSKRIEELTEAQKARLPYWRDAAYAAGTSTEPADRPRAEKAILELYKECGFEQPQEIVWVNGPLDGARFIYPEDPASILSDACFGQHDAFWAAFYMFFRHECDLKAENDPEGKGLNRTVDLHWELIQSCGWFWAQKHRVVMCERMEVMKLQDNVPHSAVGPAIKFRDGLQISSWRGIVIPDEWVAGKPPTAQQALTHPQIEQRRCAMEILGWDIIIKELKCKVLDTHPLPRVGTLLQADLPGSPGEKFLKVECGTGRTFVIPVDKSVRTAIQAQLVTTPGLTEEMLLDPDYVRT